MKENLKMSLSMIGDNNKSLRRTHNLTQPEFEKIIQIFCNSLRCYENSTSKALTVLID